MNKLLQGSPLKSLGNTSVGKIRQHKQEPLVPILWSKQTRLDVYMHYQFGQLELVLTKWDRMRFWELEHDPLTKKLGDQADAIVNKIQSSWINYDMKDEATIQEYISRSQMKILYPRAMQFTQLDVILGPQEDENASNIQLHYHRMALLGQALATCDSILTSLQHPKRLPLAHLMAYLYQCLNIQHQPNFVEYRTRIEQRFDEIKNTPESTMNQDELEWMAGIAKDIQNHILCNSTKDQQHQILRACSCVFDIMKQSTASALPVNSTDGN
ncbi:uncharacterized protein BX664DRAFT_315772 [Halteromyces radiatus]|uniref:uncharacterized protein n=1 Tax=Halteromyces radiatus TaxID=101107 RepID=UPI00221E78E8|nr:uncharacterized protein BX664DRAFT_315772 [Halteromyces radiatus]KAI8086587.1 hypothetical protein BX664DRAFT_315772 [Halteromyces radiatus]